MRVRILAIVLALVAVAPPAMAQAQDLARARALDKEGAKAYADGRYNDAARYFDDAYRQGGPPFELWNIAKCQLKLDQPAQAAETLEKYLATPNLPPDDKREASEQLETLRKKPSTLTLGSSPPGATVSIDGQPASGKTPLSTTLAPGSHTLTLSLANHATYTNTVDARFGRAVIVDVALAETSTPPPSPSAPAETPTPEAPSNVSFDPGAHFALRGAFGVMLPGYGDLGGSAGPALLALATYRFYASGKTSFGAGVLFHVTHDAWESNVAQTNTAQPCGQLTDHLDGTASSFFGVADAAWDVVQRVRAVGIAGVGLATYSGGQAGGDLFAPTCSLSPGVRGAFVAGVEVDYALTKKVRIVAMPLLLQLHTGFGGARVAPIDTTGLWTRATFAVGAGVDL